MKKLLFGILTLVLLVVVIAAAAELMARAEGYEPYKAYTHPIRLEGGDQLFQKDDVLGFKLNTGNYVVHLNDSFSFKATHTAQGLRRSYPADKFVLKDPEKIIWVFGGSYTYGWSVNDQETFPALLQQQCIGCQVVNFGVPAYGTLQSLMQLEQAIEQNCAPDIVVLAYAGFHDMRNVDSRMWGKTLAPFNRLGPMTRPVTSYDSTGNTAIDNIPLVYEPFPWQDRSALVHFYEQWYNTEQLTELHAQQVSQQLVVRFDELVRACGSRFVLATLVQDERSYQMIEHCRSKGIEHTDMLVDLRQPGMTNEPNDSHPSAKAHKAYAKALEFLLEDF